MTNNKKLRNKLALTVTTLGIACSLGGAILHVNADTYYGNGVHCNKHTCHVDWSQAWNSVGHIVVNGWLEHGPAAHQ